MADNSSSQKDVEQMMQLQKIIFQNDESVNFIQTSITNFKPQQIAEAIYLASEIKPKLIQFLVDLIKKLNNIDVNGHLMKHFFPKAFHVRDRYITATNCAFLYFLCKNGIFSEKEVADLLNSSLPNLSFCSAKLPIETSSLYVFANIWLTKIYSKFYPSDKLMKFAKIKCTEYFANSGIVTKYKQIDTKTAEPEIEIYDLSSITDGNTKLDSLIYGVDWFLQKNPTAFMVAAYYGDVNKLKEYLGNGIDLSITDSDNKNVAHYALAGGNLEIIQILLDQKVDFSYTPYNNDSLTQEEQNTNQEVQNTKQEEQNKKQEEQNTNQKEQNTNQEGQNKEQEQKGSKQFENNRRRKKVKKQAINTVPNIIPPVSLQISPPPPPEISSIITFPELIVLFHNNFLFDKFGYKMDAKVIQFSIMSDNIEMILRGLLEVKNLVDESHNTPLHYATKYGWLTSFKFILAQSTIDVNQLNKDSQTAFGISVFQDNTEFVELFLGNNKIDPNCRMFNENVMLCCYFDRYNYNHPQPNNVSGGYIKGHIGFTPFHYATLYCKQETLDLLKNDLFVNVNDQNCSGFTALHLAVFNKNAERVKYLLSIPRLDVNVQDNCGRTPFFLSIKVFQNNSVNQILWACNRVDFETRDSRNWTVLHELIDSNMLIDFKKIICLPLINVNKKNKLGDTPLHFSLTKYNKNLDFALELIKHPKIIVNEINSKMISPLDLAIMSKFQDIVDLLTLKNAKHGQDILIGRQLSHIQRKKMREMMKEKRENNFFIYLDK